VANQQIDQGNEALLGGHVQRSPSCFRRISEVDVASPALEQLLYGSKIALLDGSEQIHGADLSVGHVATARIPTTI
jgi:hypothetical protein